MQGVVNDEILRGIIPRVIHYVFDYINKSSEDIQFTIYISMMEVYNEKLRVSQVLKK